MSQTGQDSRGQGQSRLVSAPQTSDSRRQGHPRLAPAAQTAPERQIGTRQQGDTSTPDWQPGSRGHRHARLAPGTPDWHQGRENGHTRLALGSPDWHQSRGQEASQTGLSTKNRCTPDAYGNILIDWHIACSLPPLPIIPIFMYEYIKQKR